MDDRRRSSSTHRFVQRPCAGCGVSNLDYLFIYFCRFENISWLEHKLCLRINCPGNEKQTHETDLLWIYYRKDRDNTCKETFTCFNNFFCLCINSAHRCHIIFTPLLTLCFAESKAGTGNWAAERGPTAEVAQDDDPQHRDREVFIPQWLARMFHHVMIVTNSLFLFISNSEIKSVFFTSSSLVSSFTKAG